METNRAAEITPKIKRLLCKMRISFFLSYPFRNNPRNREKYYFGLISIVGYNRWKDVNETVRMNWESARPSFDRMFGMVKNFADNPEEYSKLFGIEPQKKTEAKKIIEPLNALCAEMKKSLDEINALKEKYKEATDAQMEEFEKLKKLVAIEDDLRKCCTDLNKILLPSDSK